MMANHRHVGSLNAWNKSETESQEFSFGKIPTSRSRPVGLSRKVPQSLHERVTAAKEKRRIHVSNQGEAVSLSRLQDTPFGKKRSAPGSSRSSSGGLATHSPPKKIPRSRPRAEKARVVYNDIPIGSGTGPQLQSLFEEDQDDHPIISKSPGQDLYGRAHYGAGAGAAVGGAHDRDIVDLTSPVSAAAGGNGNLSGGYDIDEDDDLACLELDRVVQRDAQEKAKKKAAPDTASQLDDLMASLQKTSAKCEERILSEVPSGSRHGDVSSELNALAEKDLERANAAAAARRSGDTRRVGRSDAHDELDRLVQRTATEKGRSAYGDDADGCDDDDDDDDDELESDDGGGGGGGAGANIFLDSDEDDDEETKALRARLRRRIERGPTAAQLREMAMEEAAVWLLPYERNDTRHLMEQLVGIVHRKVLQLGMQVPHEWTSGPTRFDNIVTQKARKILSPTDQELPKSIVIAKFAEELVAIAREEQREPKEPEKAHIADVIDDDDSDDDSDDSVEVSVSDDDD